MSFPGKVNLKTLKLEKSFMKRRKLSDYKA